MESEGSCMDIASNVAVCLSADIHPWLHVQLRGYYIACNNPYTYFLKYVFRN
jgi:hypothetical protein